MERIGVVGLSWRQGDLRALEPFTIAVDARAERLPELARELGVDGLVYLATCNRVELTFVTPAGARMEDYRRRIFSALRGRQPEPGEAERTLRAWAGEGAVEHLFLLASGLDSARLGEPEINGQMRKAVETAESLELMSPLLDKVFGAAFRVAREVRASTPLGQGHLSLAEIAIARLRESLPAANGVLTLIGASEMTERCGAALLSQCAQVYAVSRSLASAERLSRQIRAAGGDAATAPRVTVLELEHYLADPPATDALVSATGAPGVVLDARAVRALRPASAGVATPLLVDLAVPADVDDDACRAMQIPRLGMDEILAEAKEQRCRRERDAADARALVDDALERFRDRMRERKLSKALGQIQNDFQTTARSSIEQLLCKQLRHLSQQDQEAISAWAGTTARKFAHLPSTGLKALAGQHGIGAVEAFLGRSIESSETNSELRIRDDACDEMRGDV